MSKGLIKITGVLFISFVAMQTAYSGSQIHLKNLTLDSSRPNLPSTLMSMESVNSLRHYLVQFKNIISSSDQEMLEAYGFKILRYVPDNTYIVQVSDKSDREALSRHSSVDKLIPYVPQFKVNKDAFQVSIFNKNEKRTLHIRAFENLDYDAIEKSLELIPGLEVVHREGSAFTVQARLDSLAAIAQIDGLEWIDQYHEISMQMLPFNEFFQDPPFGEETPNKVSDLNGLESGIQISGFEKAWARGFTGAGQVVSVADTGLDNGRFYSLNTEFSKFKRGIIRGLFSSTWADSVGHGTHVAGSIIATGDKSQKKVRGGAYNANLIAISIWSEIYNRITIGSDPSPLFQEAYDQGVRVHSNSWGSFFNGYDDVARSVDEFIWENPEALIVFAAGNLGIDANHDGRVDGGSISSPGTAKNVLTVGASENLVDMERLGMFQSQKVHPSWPVSPLSEDNFSNNINGIAAFSSRGPAKDNRIKPDIVAPGTNILSLCSQYKYAKKQLGKFNDDLCFGSGTSMSTPIVSAGALVVREMLAKAGINSPSAALVKGILMHTADDLYPGQFGATGEANGQELLVPGPNNNQGYGRLNMDKATAGGLHLISSRKGLRTQKTHSYKLANGTRKITLSYTDAPGSTVAKKALVNDLDIEVYVRGGQIFKSDSRINNIEQVVLPEGQKAIVVKVVAVNVPMNSSTGGQPYSLVASQ